MHLNHATLAGLDFEDEVAAALAYGIFGSIDMNRGDSRNGWDADQFPNNAQELTPAMLHLISAGGFTTGGFHFDAKLRRQSIDAAEAPRAQRSRINTSACSRISSVRRVTER